VSLVLDGEASAADVLAVASHLRRCARCRRFARAVAELTSTLRAARLERVGCTNTISLQIRASADGRLLDSTHPSLNAEGQRDPTTNLSVFRRDSSHKR
jgi:predicted anti-sigma-YlaC factor YlaD